MQVARLPSGFLCRRHPFDEGRLGIPLLSLLGPRSSSAVETGTSGFLSRPDMDFGVPM